MGHPHMSPHMSPRALPSPSGPSPGPSPSPNAGPSPGPGPGPGVPAATQFAARPGQPDPFMQLGGPRPAAPGDGSELALARQQQLRELLQRQQQHQQQRQGGSARIEMSSAETHRRLSALNTARIAFNAEQWLVVRSG